jgi:hypothetical protein
MIIGGKNNKNIVQRREIYKSYKVLYELIFDKNYSTNQEDATEVLNIILDNFPDDYKNIFIFNTLSKTYCEKNNKIYGNSEKKESSNILSLQLNPPNASHYSLSQLINEYTIKEKLNSNLEQCEINSSSYKKIDIGINKHNKYLFISLIRSKVITSQFKNRTEDFKQIYVTKKVNIEYQLKINNNKYKLIGVILKSGTAEHGHYIYCTIKKNILHKIYDDDQVYNKLKGNFNLEKNSYVLLYNKINKTSKKLVKKSKKSKKTNKLKYINSINKNSHKKEFQHFRLIGKISTQIIHPPIEKHHDHIRDNSIFLCF